ncbi:MAG: HD domain-containing protein [Deltaproteobacteria bacterium]|nr:MAG: HD domain-containing protein [Deltaproteobacteria bacterium]
MSEGSVRDKLLSSEIRTLHCPPGEAGSSPYAPIHVSALIPGERITFNLYLKVAQKETHDFAYPCFLKVEEVWDRQWQDLLAQKDIHRLYFLKEDLGSVISYLNNHLQLLSHQTKKVTRKLLVIFSEHLNLSIRLAFQSSGLGPAVQIAYKQVETLIEKLQNDPPAVKLVWMILYHDYNLFNHSINLCLLGTAFMVFLKKPRKECLDLGLAGLFHDIGMTHVPQELLLKGEPLTPEERTQVNHHPMLGHRLLSKHTSLTYLPHVVLRLCLEHHENADGSGYPQGLPLSRQHPLTRVIRLLDSYDSLTINRPYRSAYKPFEAIKILQETNGPRGSIYDSETLKQFILFHAPD